MHHQLCVRIVGAALMHGCHGVVEMEDLNVAADLVDEYPHQIFLTP